MRVLFAGPSLFGTTCDAGGIEVREPAAQGDIARATLEGATSIGLIDGRFEAVAAVWHKEILFALSEGVAVLGAASIGALRAAECAEFGMEPVGGIAEDYRSGVLVDDAAVAITHGPAEMGYAPFTEALVDVEATLDAMVGRGDISPSRRSLFSDRSSRLFFKDRSIEALFDGEPDARELIDGYRVGRVSRKSGDALELVQRLQSQAERRRESPDWTLAQPYPWRAEIERLRKEFQQRV